MPNKIVSLWKSKYFKMALLVLLGVAAALIIMAMWLGNQAGQFVIRVQSGNVQKSIAVTTEKDKKETYQPSIVAPSMDSMTDYSPKYFLQEDFMTLRQITSNPTVNPEDVDYDNHSLYVYTFYIINTSSSGGVGINVSLTYSSVSNHMDEIVRVLSYYESYNNKKPLLYQKQDSLERAGVDRIEYPHYIISPTPFAEAIDNSSGTVFNNQSINIGYGDGMNYVKYSILFWLEGDDPDSEYYQEQLLSGTIKFDMTITVSM